MHLVSHAFTKASNSKPKHKSIMRIHYKIEDIFLCFFSNKNEQSFQCGYKNSSDMVRGPEVGAATKRDHIKEGTF